MSVTKLRHGKIELALHTLRGGAGRPLLMLHGLGEQSPRAVPPEFAAWEGPVSALDFTGHGDSLAAPGGGYTAEVLMADADAALQHLERATLCGRGLGGYVAVLLAGARPRQVRGAIVCDGSGLAGGGSKPVTPLLIRPVPREGNPDPFALSELARDLRPPDYATSFVRQANQLSELERPLTVCARERPDWLAAVVEEPGVEQADLAEALDYYARIPSD